MPSVSSSWSRSFSASRRALSISFLVGSSPSAAGGVAFGASGVRFLAFSCLTLYFLTSWAPVKLGSRWVMPG